MAVAGALIYGFLLLTFVTAGLAARSIWRFRYKWPFTPLRLGVLLASGIFGILAAAVTTDEPQVFTAIVGAVLVASATWLGLYGLNPAEREP
jgi:hypothetical protein